MDKVVLSNGNGDFTWGIGAELDLSDKPFLILFVFIFFGLN